MQIKSNILGTVVGAVLKQLHINICHPFECFLKRLNDTKSRYSTIACEILGCILAIECKHPYLIGRAFDILTDHAPN